MTFPPPLFKRLLQMLRGENPSSAAMRESLEEVIEESERQSPALSEQERVMLTNLLAFGELKVSDVMVPRAEIVAADETMPLPELVTLFRAAQHSRLPVYRDTLDDPTGLVHVKDVMALLELRPRRRLPPGADPPFRHQAAGAVCAAFHARPRPAAENAGQPHPSGAGD